MFSTLLLVTGCSKSEVVTSYEQEVAKQDYTKQQPTQQEVNNQPVPVIFDVVSEEQATTRALTTEDILKQDGSGFGVFAYYTHGAYPASNSNSTSEATDVAPNFMYNQKVYWDTDLDPDAWNYTPTKYWPNDFSTGAVDNQDPAATGSSTDKLSFFAYGPYANQVTLSATTYTLEPSTGRFKNGSNYFDEQTGASGILGFKSNSTTSDPKVHFRLGAGAEDLVWSSLKDKTKMTGTPLINYVPTFAFAHALSGLRFEVGGNFDAVSGGQIADGTYITIESVSVASDAMPYDGWLNLTTGTWQDQATAEASTSILLDDINEKLQYKSNATLAYNSGAAGEVNQGVGRNDNGTASDALTTRTLMKQVNGADQYLMIMPSATAVTYKVTCNYHVWTFDPRNADGISKVENNVTNKVSFAPDGNKFYTITIWLGMTSVGLDVKQFNNTNEHDVYFTDVSSSWNLPQ